MAENETFENQYADGSMDEKRQYELPLGELVDKLTILQLRELLLNTDKYSKEIQQLEHDIDLVFRQKCLPGFHARTMRMVFIMGQLNTLIWLYKDRMVETPDQYAKYLKLSHQVNGLKNSVKNRLMEEMDESSTGLRTNVSTDGLEYHVSL